MFGLLKQLLKSPPTPIDPLLWQATRARVPWVGALDELRDQRLQALTGLFLRDKVITAVDDLHLDAQQRCMLAALCCLPVMEIGASGLRGWTQLIVYPEAFRVNRTHVDAAGVMHEGEDELIGEAWSAGPVILSWADVQADCDDPHAGFCVAAHEIAHKLDLLDGVLDGSPPLPREWQRRWAADFQRGYDALVAEADAGRDTAIDAYAAEAPEEFFAVATEYHFSDPRRLRDAFPHVAMHLERLYGPSPFASAGQHQPETRTA